MCRRTLIDDKIKSNIVIKDCGYETPCHVWQGSHSGTGRGGGYPRMSLDGQTVAVHIVAYTNNNGFVPGKKQIDHKCNNRLCVNPDHLQMVTHKKNQKLRIERSRKASNVTSILEQHSQLPGHDASLHDRGGDQVPEFAGISEDEEAAIEDSIDGRYLPDRAFWETPAHLRS